MVFSSSFFIFVFLPICLILVGVLHKKLHNSVLLVASIFFYGWGSVSHTFILIASIFLNYLFGLLIGKYDGQKSKFILMISIVTNLGVLGYFKYYNFFMDNINSSLDIFGVDTYKYAQVVLPIGISFFTFQAMSYVIDVYRKKTPVQKNIFDLALYVSLFPQLIAGPIVRYFDVAEQLKNRVISIEKVSIGIQRFIFGFSKKVIIANSMAMVADNIFNLPVEEISSGVSWLGIVAYSLQIYFDFSGYSDMAIGLGKVFGFDFPENFNFPYISKSIKEFWRRWHISLSSWFRDYLYIPLGGNRKGAARTLINLMIVFLATGIWHGASWNFVIWGLFHGCLLLLERKGLDKVLGKLGNPIQISYTLLLVMIGWVFFRVENLGDALTYIGRMSFIYESDSVKVYLAEYLDYKTALVLILGVFYSFRGFRFLMEMFQNILVLKGKANQYQFIYYSTKLLVSLGLMFISILYLSASTYNPFIYFRF